MLNVHLPPRNRCNRRYRSRHFVARPSHAPPGRDLRIDHSRWFDATVGRWLSEDPAAADVNLYRYCGNSPSAYVDPSGLQFIITLPEAPKASLVSRNKYWTTELWTDSSGNSEKVRVVAPCTIVIEVRHFPTAWNGGIPLAIDPTNRADAGLFGMLTCWASHIRSDSRTWPELVGGSTGGIANWPTIIGMIGNADPSQLNAFWRNFVLNGIGYSTKRQDLNGGLGRGDPGFIALMNKAKGAAIAQAKKMMQEHGGCSADPKVKCRNCSSVRIVFHVPEPAGYNWVVKVYRDIKDEITVLPDGTTTTQPVSSFDEQRIRPRAVPPPQPAEDL